MFCRPKRQKDAMLMISRALAIKSIDTLTRVPKTMYKLLDHCKIVEQLQRHLQRYLIQICSVSAKTARKYYVVN